MSQSSSIDPSVDSVAGRLRNMMCWKKFLFCQHELESSIFVVFLAEVLNVVKQCFVDRNTLYLKHRTAYSADLYISIPIPGIMRSTARLE
ncbi:hypothetical protein CsSME_00005731 [Camellia sinensis var. sinensis]